jgi:hypothetical protein
MDTSVLITIAGSVGGLFGWYIHNQFKSPRDVQGDAERRISALETLYAGLSLKVEGTHARHDLALDSLTKAVEKLTDRFDKFAERFGNGHRGGN